MWVVNTYTKDYQLRLTQECLATEEHDKKRKYFDSCLQQFWHFSVFVTSVDGLIGMEAETTLKELARQLATKCKQPYSWTCGYVRSRVGVHHPSLHHSLLYLRISCDRDTGQCTLASLRGWRRSQPVLLREQRKTG